MPNKKKEKKEEQKTESPEKKPDKQIYMVLIAMAILIAVFFASYFIFKSFNTFTYEGLTFTKEKFGEILVFHHYYLFNSQGELFQYNLYVRNDPRKNSVPITGKAVDEGIEFRQDNFVYISVNPENLTQCEYTLVGLSNLASFLSDNQLNVKGAAPIKELANETNVRYATCDTHPDDEVIIVQAGNETKIIQENDNCHIIQIANCEVLPAIEKFQIKSILDARKRSTNQRVSL